MSQERQASMTLVAPSWVRAIAIVAAGGLVIGILTSIGQGALPSDLSSVANSAGAWSLVAFLLCLSNADPRRGLLLGFVALAAMLLGYQVATELRGYATGRSIWLFWGIAAIVAGPALGVAAAWVRGRDPRRIAFGAAVIAGVLIGEGVYGLTRIAATTSSIYWTLQIVVGLGIVVAASVVRLRRPAPIALCAGSAAAIAASFYVVYSSI